MNITTYSIRAILFIALTSVNLQVFGQIKGLKKLNVKHADSIYLKGGRAYAIKYVKRSGEEHHYYLLDSDDTTTLRKTHFTRVEKVVEAPKVNENISVLDKVPLIGKELLVKITPFSPSLSRYWQVVIDDGVNGNYLLTDDTGDKIKLLSEMSIVNYLIGRGWKLHLIQNVETGEVAGGTNIVNALIGGSVTLSKNVYFFKALYEGN